MVEQISDKIAQRSRADQRDHQERARADTVIAKRIGKSVAAVGQIERLALGNINQSADPNCGVDGEPTQSLERFAGFELKQVIEEINRLQQIAEEVAQPLAHRFGQAVFIGVGNGSHHGLVHTLGQFEGDLVDRHQGVPFDHIRGAGHHDCTVGLRFGCALGRILIFAQHAILGWRRILDWCVVFWLRLSRRDLLLRCRLRQHRLRQKRLRGQIHSDRR